MGDRDRGRWKIYSLFTPIDPLEFGTLCIHYLVKIGRSLLEKPF